MIAYLEGTLFKLEGEKAIVLVNQLGYEIMLPATVTAVMQTKSLGDFIALHIYYNQTERQPKPTLIGFLDEIDKEFFQHFISVEDIGPMKAVKAMTLPVGEIARAIEESDLKYLGQLKGIGARTAQKIVATLKGKVAEFATGGGARTTIAGRPIVAGLGSDSIVMEVLDVLVNQLGYKALNARYLVNEALGRNPDVNTAEELLDIVLTAQK